MKVRITALMILALALVLIVGCSDNKSLNPFQPEIINNADNFAFQATAIKNVSATLQYNWSNSGDSAKVNQASAITRGTATVTLYDDAGTQVYSGSLTSDGDFFSSLGVAGTWQVKVVLSNLSGTLNFRAQKQ
jgi:hypothetical protein